MKWWRVALAIGLLAAGCSKSGADPNRVDCGHLNRRVLRCAEELGIGGVAQGDTSGAGLAERLMSQVTETLGTECQDKAGKMEKAREVNACLDKGSCKETADCLLSLTP